MTAISKDLYDALNSNRIAYLGSVFLLFFLLMMIMRFCGIKRRKPLTVALVAVDIVMLAITTSPGILPIYYITVDIQTVDSFWYKDASHGDLIAIMDRTIAGEHVFSDKTPEVKLGLTTSYELTRFELDVLRALMQSTGDEDGASHRCGAEKSHHCYTR